MGRELLLLIIILSIFKKADAQNEFYRPEFHFTPKTN